MKGSFEAWMAEVLRCVRFLPDRKAIRQELEAHYEDHVRDLERLGYDRQLARKRTLGAMGDPLEVGRALDRIHKPWLGWLWLASKGMLLLCIMLALFYTTEGAWRFQEFYMPPDPSSYEADGFAFDTDHTSYTRVAVSRGGSVEVCGYEISVPYAALWRWANEHGEHPYYSMTLVLGVRNSRFWEKDPDPAMGQLTLRDDSGGLFAASEEYYDYTVEERDQRWAGCVHPHGVRSGPFYSEYWYWITSWEQPPQWTELVCPSGEGFTLRLEWEGAE